MNLKKTFILALVLAVALVFIFKSEIPREVQEQETKRPFMNVTKGSFERIEIKNETEQFALVNHAPSKIVQKDSAAIEEEGLAQSWEIDGRPGANLDNAKLNSLLTDLTNLHLENEIPAEETEKDLEVYGLAQPKLDLSVKASGKSYQILFGKKNEYVGKRYVKLGDKASVYLALDSLFSSGSQSQKNFRDATPIEFLNLDLAKVTIENGTGKFVLSQLAAAAWEISEPLKAAASAAKLSTLGVDLRNLRADEYIDNPGSDLSEYGLDKPSALITLDFKDPVKNPTLRVALVKKDLGDGKTLTYFQVSSKPTVFQINRDTTTPFLKPLEDYREKNLFKFVPEQVVRLEATVSTNTPIIFEKQDNAWKVNGKIGDNTFVEEYIKNLSRIEATGFPLADSDFGFAAPFMKFVLKISSGSGESKTEAERTLVVGSLSTDGKGRFAQDILDKTVFIIGNEDLKRLSRKEETLIAAATPAPLATPTQGATPSGTIAPK